MNKKRFYLHLAIYLFIAFVVLAVSPFIGSEKIALSTLLEHITNRTSGMDTEIFFRLRVPRVLLGFLAGGSLAIVGAVFQAILRNPLATPYTLGITGGSAIGAYLSIAFPVFVFDFGIFSSIQLFAFAGAAVAMLFIYTIAKKPGGVSMTNLLLAGVTFGILCSAFLLLIRYLAEPNLLVSMDRWTMGALDVTGFGEIAVVLPMLFGGLGLLFMQLNVLNHLSLGNEMAAGHGVDVKSVHGVCFFAGSLTTATVVSVAGPIAFVGLLVPHIVRRISGYDHRVILPGSFLLGGGFLVICDTIARIIIAPSQMPTGIITALLGGIFFVYLLVKRI